MWDEERWVAATRRNARSVQTTIGWIFWDPGAVARYSDMGLPGPLGYIAARCAPLSGSGPEPVIAAFGSISPMAIRMTFDLVSEKTSFDAAWQARDEAVLEGLREFAPGIVDPLEAAAGPIWDAVERLPSVGRPFFAAHLAMDRPADPLLSGWHAVNCIREWRGDTHWAVVAAHGLSGVEVSILHNEWLYYEEDWIPRSRGTDSGDLEQGWASLRDRGLADGRSATPAGLDLRQRIEDETDRLTTTPWRLLGEEFTSRFAEDFEPPCELLLARVDETAGVNYQPGSRVRNRG